MRLHEIKAYEILLEATSPIAHHSEVFGNHAVIARRKVRLPSGEWSHVPAVSGDSLRHGLREASAYAFLDASGMLDEGRLSEAALRLLFSGGMVTGRGDAANIKLDDYRTMVDLVPMLGLLGGCADNRVIPGRMIVEDALLVCDESAHLVPAWMTTHGGALSSARSHIAEHQRVRMDATLDPGKRKLLGDVAVRKIEGKLRKSEAAHEVDNPIDTAEAKSSMMPRTFEAIASGSRLSWRVQATCTSELDVDTFHAMVGAFLGNARVGGKRGTGFGLVRAVAANEVTVQRPSDAMQAVDATALGPRVGELFRSHVRERAAKAREFLSGVNA
jgi:CRISPR type IV-associated protein Csf2